MKRVSVTEGPASQPMAAYKAAGRQRGPHRVQWGRAMRLASRKSGPTAALCCETKRRRWRRSGVGEESGTRAGGGRVGRRAHEEEWRGFRRGRGGRRARGEEWWLSRPCAGGGDAQGLVEAAPRAPWTGLRGWERGGIGARLGPPPQCCRLWVRVELDEEELGQRRWSEAG